MRLGTWLLSACALAIAVTGCSDSDKEPASGPDKASMAVAEALTTGVEFKKGVLKRGGIPKPSADDVEIEENDAPLELEPGDTALMSLDVENPNQDEDPVVATLIQFEGSDDHVEVAVDGGDGGTGDGSKIETSFELDDAICEAFCNKKFPIKMIQAIKLESGDVSKHIERTFNLDCSADGDADKCEKADDEPKPDAGKQDDGNGGTVGVDSPSGPLSGAMVDFNRAHCVTCNSMSKAYCETAPFPQPDVQCLAKVLDANIDDDVTTWINCVAAGLGANGGAYQCSQSCNDQACSPAAFETAAEACEALPATLQTKVDDCLMLPDAGTATL